MSLECKLVPTIKLNFKQNTQSFKLDVAFEVPAQGVTAIFGPSGSGKTSLLRCIAGLEKSGKGFFSIDDEVWQSDKTFLPTHSREVGYVFQEPSLLAHLNVQKNLNYARDRSRQPIDNQEYQTILDMLGIEHLLDHPVKFLSGGEQQRIAIARALLVKPRILLLDEPLASLDQQRKLEVLSYLQKLREQLSIPIFYVSHSQDEVVRLADHLVLLQQGKVVQQGSFKAMMLDAGMRQQFCFTEFSVLFGKVHSVVNNYQLTEVKVGNLILRMPAQEVQQGQEIRLHIHAKDVSIALTQAHNSSILNIFPASIVAIGEAGASGQRHIQLQFEEQVLSAKVSSFSCEQLALKVNDKIFIQIKALSVVQ